MAFNWHELDRNHVLHWALVHAMVQKKGKADKEAIALISERSNNLTEVDITMTINGVEYDGARLIEDLYHSMSASFDKAVAEAADEKYHEKWMVLEDVIDRARRALHPHGEERDW